MSWRFLMLSGVKLGHCSSKEFSAEGHGVSAAPSIQSSHIPFGSKGVHVCGDKLGRLQAANTASMAAMSKCSERGQGNRFRAVAMSGEVLLC